MKRRKVKSSESRRDFRRNATRVNTRNIITRPMRGGIRL